MSCTVIGIPYAIAWVIGAIVAGAVQTAEGNGLYLSESSP